MKLLLRQKIWLALILTSNTLLWVIPSNIVAQIARDRHTLLGRYSREHFACNLAVLIISLLGLYIDRATGAAYKRRWFQVVAAMLSVIAALVVVDLLLRTRQRVYYIKDTLAYHRVPNERYGDTFVDRPLAALSYPHVPPGYPPITGTLHTDARGYRNASALSRADVVVLGDSFAEGSGVSDEHSWAIRLAAKTGLSVYNLGMSGYDPLNYLASLKEYGLSLQPRWVLCMLYEGNDFRSAKSDAERTSPSLGERFGTYWKQSPVVEATDRFLLSTFGRLRIDAPVRGIEILDWLPLAIPVSEPRYYTFAPKQLVDLLIDSNNFAEGSKWRNTARILSELKDACAGANSRLVILYAPSKAHVVFPLVAEELPADKVRALMALDGKGELPPGPELIRRLVERADGRESVVRDCCERESVIFVSLTEPLREACAQGRQAYFTYDQHWTPLGHEVAAAVVTDRWPAWSASAHAD